MATFAIGVSNTASAGGVSDLGRYHQILIDPLDVDYSDEFMANRGTRRHAVVGADLVRMQRRFHRVVAETLGGDLPVTTQPGPGVLRIDAVLIDHVLDKSDWWGPAKTVFAPPGRIRLIAELRDSQTGRLIHRVGLDLHPRSSRMQRQSPIEYWSYMRQVFNRVAVRVRWAVEQGAATQT